MNSKYLGYVKWTSKGPESKEVHEVIDYFDSEKAFDIFLDNIIFVKKMNIIASYLQRM